MSEKTDDMKKPILFALTVLTMLSAFCSCGGGGKKFDWEKATLEEKLEHMRSDSSWIHELDSMAYVAVGPGAKCLDPVKHLFVCDGRYWVYNQDWGGVLELPEGYIPCDDTWQVELSYHGAGTWSPDSLVYISHYEGFQPLEYDEFEEELRTRFDEDSITAVTSFRVDDYVFPDGYVSKSIAIETENTDGIVGYLRYIFRDVNGVEYAVSVQYQSGEEEKVTDIMKMIDRYPLNADGRIEVGGAL